MAKEHPHPLALSFLGFGQALYLDAYLFSPSLAWDYFIGTKNKILSLYYWLFCDVAAASVDARQLKPWVYSELFAVALQILLKQEFPFSPSPIEEDVRISSLVI